MTLFLVLPLRFSTPNISYHKLFIKEHCVRINDISKPLGQTLFVLNVPPYITEDNLKNAFSLAGDIQQVIFDFTDNNFAKNDGFKRAYIVFKTREILLKALKLTYLNVLPSEEIVKKIGVGKWIQDYNDTVKSPEELQKQIDDFMKTYDEYERSSKTNFVDDEGWTVVTKSSRKPGFSRKESVINKLDDKSMKKMKKKELKNFYTFQIRESHMKNIAELRKNYEEAKNKVRLMKEARKFKP